MPHAKQCRARLPCMADACAAACHIHNLPVFWPYRAAPKSPMPKYTVSATPASSNMCVKGMLNTTVRPSVLQHCCHTRARLVGTVSARPVEVLRMCMRMALCFGVLQPNSPNKLVCTACCITRMPTLPSGISRSSGIIMGCKHNSTATTRIKYSTTWDGGLLTMLLHGAVAAVLRMGTGCKHSCTIAA